MFTFSFAFVFQVWSVALERRKEITKHINYYCRIAVSILVIPPSGVDSFTRKVQIGNRAALSKESKTGYLTISSSPAGNATIVLIHRDFSCEMVYQSPGSWHHWHHVFRTTEGYYKQGFHFFKSTAILYIDSNFLNIVLIM